MERNNLTTGELLYTIAFLASSEDLWSQTEGAVNPQNSPPGAYLIFLFLYGGFSRGLINYFQS